MEAGNACQPMPEYFSHKRVRALKIKSVAYKGEDVHLEFEGDKFNPRTVPVQDRPKPEIGWYMITYADGYISFSPAKQFEEGYSLVEDKPIYLSPEEYYKEPQ